MDIGQFIKLTRRSIGFQRCDDTWLCNFIGSTIIHIHSSQEQYITLFSDTGGNGLHDLRVDGLFVISHQVLVQQLLDLVGREPIKLDTLVMIQGLVKHLHPADVLNNLNIIQSCLLQLKKLRCLL